MINVVFKTSKMSSTPPSATTVIRPVITASVILKSPSPSTCLVRSLSSWSVCFSWGELLPLLPPHVFLAGNWWTERPFYIRSQVQSAIRAVDWASPSLFSSWAGSCKCPFKCKPSTSAFPKRFRLKHFFFARGKKGLLLLTLCFCARQELHV